MAVSRTLSVLVFCIILCAQALEQRPPRGRQSKRDTLVSSMFSAFSNVDKRLAALEASWNNSTEERLAQLKAKVEEEMQEKQQHMEERLQIVQNDTQRLESMVLELLSSRLESMVTEILTSKMKSSEAKVAELVEAKTNATEERLASLEASNTEAQSSPAACKYQFLYQYEKEAPHSSADSQRVAKLESELTRLQEKMSALDKRLQDNDLRVDTLHNASVLAIDDMLHSMTELVAASKQNLMSTMENATKLLHENIATMMNATFFTSIAASEQSLKSTIRNATENLVSTMNVTKVELLAKAEDNVAVLNASIATVEQTTKQLSTHVSAMEVEVQSVTERIAASEQSLKSTIQNTAENLASTMNITKAQLFAEAEINFAVLNASNARVEQSTKELATRVSTVEDNLHNATLLHDEKQEKTRAMLEDLKNTTKERCGPPQYRRTCQDYYDNGHRSSSTYILLLEDGQEPMKVYCNMTNGTGWVVFQRREDGSMDFFRNWTSYKEGFGDLEGEFWLGNRNIHRLTRAGLTHLRVDLQAWNGSSTFASYSHFSVGDARSSYKLSVSDYDYSSTAGDSLGYNNGHKFSTFDRDEDTVSGGNCAQNWKGAWWYWACTLSNLNGEYGTRGSSGDQYITWEHWLGYQSLQRTELKLK